MASYAGSRNAFTFTICSAAIRVGVGCSWPFPQTRAGRLLSATALSAAAQATHGDRLPMGWEPWRQEKSWCHSVCLTGPGDTHTHTHTHTLGPSLIYTQIDPPVFNFPLNALKYLAVREAGVAGRASIFSQPALLLVPLGHGNLEYESISWITNTSVLGLGWVAEGSTWEMC